MAPPGTPPPVNGRAHMDVQTDNFLEELTDRPIEATIETQTEAFLDRPPSPLFVPAKNGEDKETQIESGDLFDFDLEVEPILDVLVGKTLEVSMLELMEEEELAAIRAQQEKFEMMRNAELSEVQRLEYEAKRKFAEKQRRKKQEREFKEAQDELKEKVAARAFAKTYLSDLHANVFESLEETGHFYDPVRKEVGEVFLPWLMGEVSTSLTAVAQAYAAADGIIKASLEKAKDIRVQAVADYEAEQKRIAEEAAAKKAEEERLAAEAAAAAAAAEENGENGEDQ
jgi:radial spoke head protein 3